jgi:hypothetical protein
MFIPLRKRCPWSDHRKCESYDRLSEYTMICCRGDGWIVIRKGQNETPRPSAGGFLYPHLARRSNVPAPTRSMVVSIFRALRDGLGI